MNRKPLMMIGGILMIIVSVAVLVWMYVGTKDYVSTTATVTAVEFDPTVIPDDDGVTNDYKITLEYTVDGKKYQTEINAQESDYTVKDEVEIRYDPNNPQNIAIGQMSLPVFIGIAVLAVVVGIVVIIKSRRII